MSTIPLLKSSDSVLDLKRPSTPALPKEKRSSTPITKRKQEASQQQPLPKRIEKQKFLPWIFYQCDFVQNLHHIYPLLKIKIDSILDTFLEIFNKERNNLEKKNLLSRYVFFVKNVKKEELESSSALQKTTMISQSVFNLVHKDSEAEKLFAEEIKILTTLCQVKQEISKESKALSESQILEDPAKGNKEILKISEVLNDFCALSVNELVEYCKSLEIATAGFEANNSSILEIEKKLNKIKTFSRDIHTYQLELTKSLQFSHIVSRKTSEEKEKEPIPLLHNSLTDFFLEEMLTRGNVEERVVMLYFFFNLIKNLFEENNFHCAGTLYIQLSTGPISEIRLVETWTLFKKKFPRVYAEIKSWNTKFSTDKNFAAYHKTIAQARISKQPFVPFYPPIQGGIASIVDSDSLADDTTYNIQQLEVLIRLTKETMEYNYNRKNFTYKTDIVSYLKNIPLKADRRQYLDKTCWNRSYILEPKTIKIKNTEKVIPIPLFINWIFKTWERSLFEALPLICGLLKIKIDIFLCNFLEILQQETRPSEKQRFLESCIIFLSNLKKSQVEDNSINQWIINIFKYILENEQKITLKGVSSEQAIINIFKAVLEDAAISPSIIDIFRNVCAELQKDTLFLEVEQLLSMQLIETKNPRSDMPKEENLLDITSYFDKIWESNTDKKAFLEILSEDIHTFLKSLAYNLTLADLLSTTNPEEKELGSLAIGYNDLADFFLDRILDQENIEKRAELISQLFHIIKKLLKKQNYYGAHAFFSTLDSPLIDENRLKHTWKIVKQRFPSLYKNLKKWQAMFSPLNSFSKFKSVIQKAKSSFVPYYPITGQDLERTFSTELKNDEYYFIDRIMLVLTLSKNAIKYTFDKNDNVFSYKTNFVSLMNNRVRPLDREEYTELCWNKSFALEPQQFNSNT